MVGDIRIRRRKDKYHVMEEQGDGRYFTIEGGKCNSKEDAIKTKKNDFCSLERKLDCSIRILEYN